MNLHTLVDKPRIDEIRCKTTLISGTPEKKEEKTSLKQELYKSSLQKKYSISSITSASTFLPNLSGLSFIRLYTFSLISFFTKG